MNHDHADREALALANGEPLPEPPYQPAPWETGTLYVLIIVSVAVLAWAAVDLGAVLGSITY